MDGCGCGLGPCRVARPSEKTLEHAIMNMFDLHREVWKAECKPEELQLCIDNVEQLFDEMLGKYKKEWDEKKQDEARRLSEPPSFDRSTTGFKKFQGLVDVKTEKGKIEDD